MLLTETDIARDGSFGRRWLAVTERRVMTLPDEAQPRGPELELPLKALKSVRSTHLIGRVALEAETDGERVEVVQGSNTHSAKFSKIARSLNDACKDGKELEFDIEEEEQTHCPQCGRLLPEKGSFCPACLKKWEVVRRFWHYLRPHWQMVLAIMGLIMVGTGFRLAPPYLIKILVDDVLGAGGGARMLLYVVLALVGVHLGGVGTDIVRGRLSAWLGSRIIHELRFDVYQAIQGLSLKRHDKTETGALMSRLTNDTSMLNWMFTDAGIIMLPSLLQLAGICVVLLIMKWWLALLVLIPTPGVVFLMAWFHRRLHRLYHSLYQRRAKMGARAQDSIAGIRVVKAFSQEPREVDYFGERSAEYYRAAYKSEATWATVYPAIAFIITLGTYLVWYFGGLSVLRQDPTFSLGTLMAFIGYLAMFYGPLHMLTHFSNHVNRAVTAAQRLFEITDADQEVYDDPRAKAVPQIEGGIQLKNVHFGYVKDRPVLKGLELDIEPGEMIGLVGKSGAGKTTMCNLVCRFYDVDEGRILLDGTDVRQVKLRDLRRQIGIVPQDCFLFNGTIAENISYAKPGATHEEVIWAATAANAHGFIMRLTDGYDTLAGERGTHLSAGEKQRIAIARAILHGPKILILDEATSSVDTETEALIQEALARLVKGRTTFAIAHRLSTLRNADRLLVIEEGKQAELGTHEELMAEGGTYKRLVEMQSELSSVTAVGG